MADRNYRTTSNTSVDERCGRCNRQNMRSTISTELIDPYMSSDFNNRVLCEECCNELSSQCEQDNRRFESASKSRKSGKSKDSSNMKEDKSDDDLYMRSPLRSSSTESDGFYDEFASASLQLDDVDVAITTEPKEKKTYPVLWLEHSENINADYHINSEQKLRENKFILETFTADALCENHLQSDTLGKCFLIVGDSWGRKFLEKQIETANGKVRLHDHSKLAAIYVYAPTADVEIVRDTVPTLKDETVIDETRVGMGEEEPLIPVKLSRNVMAVNNYASIVVDHLLDAPRSGATPTQSVAGDIVEPESSRLPEQPNTHTSTKKLSSRLTSFLNKWCCCLCRSNVVIKTQQTLTPMPDIPSNQPAENNTNEALTQMNEEGWTKKFPKIRGSFINFADLLAQMCEDQIVVKEEVDNLLKLSVIKRDEASVQSSKNGNFIWFQIFIEALRRMKDDRDTAKTELLDLCRLVYKDDAPTLRVLNDFERDYKPQNAVYWYTQSACFYRLINKALRFQIYDTIIAFRLLINDISAQLQDEHDKEQAEVSFNFATPTIRVFRGQWMKIQELKELYNSIDNLVVTNSFLSATQHRAIALQFFIGGEINEKETPLLMVIDADNRLVTGAYANVTELSAFTNEREILFTIGCIFRIKRVYKNDGDAFHTMEIELCSRDDSELKDTYNYIRDGLPREIDFTELGDVLLKMNELRASEKCHRRALQTRLPNDLQRLRSIAGLAHLYSEVGNHDKALKIHKKVLDTQIRLLSSNDKLVGISYVNIGIEYYKLKELDKALYYYEKARQIFNECYPANHPVYCQFTNNVAIVYADKIEYDKAKKHLQMAERILKAASVPETHPDTATILGNIGAVYSQLKDAENALKFQQLAFDIRQRSLPSEHLDMAMSNHNLAILHESRDDNQLALLYYKEALRIKLSCLTQKSPEYLITWEYYKDLCQKIQDSNTMGIVIVGPSKSGKSSFGNILVGINHFQPHRHDATTESTFCFRDFCDKRLIIIDTPPTLVDYTKEQNTDAVQEQIKKCNAVLESYLRSILIVISSDTRPNEIDINSFFQQLNKHFGEETVQRKCILILTHLDLIAVEDGRTMADHLQQNSHLTEWIQRCNGYYFDGSKLQAGVDVIKRSTEILTDIVEKIRLLRTFE